MTKKVLWEKDSYDGTGLLIDPSEIENSVGIDEPGMRVWWKVDGETKIEIPRTVIIDDEEWNFNDLDYDILNEILDRLVEQEGKSYGNEFIDICNALAWDYDQKEFRNVADLYKTKTYNWWNGSNWIMEYLSDADTEYELELGDMYNLDIWDGSNHVYGGVGNHVNIYKINKIDYEDTDLILWENWSQWQGNHPIGELQTIDEVLDRLEDDEHPEIEEVRKWLRQ